MKLKSNIDIKKSKIFPKNDKIRAVIDTNAIIRALDTKQIKLFLPLFARFDLFITPTIYWEYCNLNFNNGKGPTSIPFKQSQLLKIGIKLIYSSFKTGKQFREIIANLEEKELKKHILQNDQDMIIALEVLDSGINLLITENVSDFKKFNLKDLKILSLYEVILSKFNLKLKN